MVGPSLLKEFYRERARDNLAHLQYLSRDIGEMNRVREAVAGDWESEELTRAIIFDEIQTMEYLREEIESDRKALRNLENREPIECAA
jgi:ERCC4-related helicase